LGVSFTGTLALTVAHGVTTLAAGAFGFLDCLSFRKLLVMSPQSIPPPGTPIT